MIAMPTPPQPAANDAIVFSAHLTQPSAHSLRDGSHVIVRPITPDDADRERRFIEALSPQSRRYRFLGQIAHPSDALIEQLTDIDFVHDVAFIALADDGEREVGVARYSTSADGSRCECAGAVADDFQGRGLGTVLMQRLIELARAAGIREMVSVDIAENAAMRDLALALGFTRSPDPDDASQVIHRLKL